MLTLTSFSESPLHLLTMELAEILKNVVLHSVATAFARRVFPVNYCVYQGSEFFLFIVTVVPNLVMLLTDEI